MGLTNATPMQRVTLILLRLLLGAVIAVAVCGQLGSRVIVLSSPVGVINLASPNLNGSQMSFER